jgi:hypothetical protein
MRNLSVTMAACLFVAGCSTPQQSLGTTTGVVGGALVGGPVGAVVGGVAGAVVTAPGGPLDPGYCYIYDRNGNILYHSNGRPRERRC